MNFWRESVCRLCCASRVLLAADLLTEFGCSTDVWSVTSYSQLTREAQKVARQNLLNPQASNKNYIQQQMEGEAGAFVAVSDYVKSLPNGIAQWLPSEPVVLGTDGFGLSEARDTLRDYFEVDAKFIAWGALVKLYQQEIINHELLEQAREKLSIPLQKFDPASF